MRLCSRRRALVLAARNFWSGNFITQFVRGGERLPLTEARRVLVLPSLNLLTEASRGVRRDEAQCSSMFPRRGAMQQHLKSHAATCTEQSHWLHSGYAVVTTSVTLDTRSNNTDKSGRQTANAGHAQQQHRQKRQTNRQRNKTHAATTRTAVCCSCCPPQECVLNHYTVETRAKSFAR